MEKLAVLGEDWVCQIPYNLHGGRDVIFQTNTSTS